MHKIMLWMSGMEDGMEREVRDPDRAARNAKCMTDELTGARRRWADSCLLIGPDETAGRRIPVGTLGMALSCPSSLGRLLKQKLQKLVQPAFPAPSFLGNLLDFFHDVNARDAYRFRGFTFDRELFRASLSTLL